jgi:hypothetical protein
LLIEFNPEEPAKIVEILPDTMFKLMIREAAEELKLRIGNSEISFVNLTDKVIEIPKGADVTGTLFDFCHEINVIEFKSENDEFGEREFVANHTRTSILYLQNEEANYSKYLNLMYLPATRKSSWTLPSKMV